MLDYSKLYDVIIIGGGPAGLSAAIYASRANLRVLVVEKDEFGGQIALTAKVENYPGVAPCSGRELADLMKKQAKDFGADLIYGKTGEISLEGTIKEVTVDDTVYQALSVILATGGIPGQAGFEGETEFKGSGVSYCATCDGPLFAGCPVYVVGGGPAAVEESVFLAEFSPQVTLVVREEDFTCEESISGQLKDYANIRVLFHTQIVSVSGEMTIEEVILTDNLTGRTWVERSDPDPEGLPDPIGVFVFVGYHPDTAWLPDGLKKDGAGCLLTDDRMRTSMPGVYAAGDVRQKELRQVVTAVSDGALAAVDLEPYVKKIHTDLNIPGLKKDGSDILSSMEGKAVLNLWLDDSDLAREMEEFLREKEELKDKVEIRIHREGRDDLILPSIEICSGDGVSSGIHFHAVPKGLEWNSFRIALFNVAGPGQKIRPEILNRIKGIDRKINFRILATLTCSKCPATVMAACQIAALNDHVTAEMFDIMHFGKLRFKYNVQSVPVTVINEDKLILGKMEVEDLLNEIGK